MKKKIIFIFIALLLKSFSFSQVSISPDDEFYIDVTGWLLKGIIYYVPQTKPYPVNTVKSILNKVLDSDSESDVKKAEYYCSKYFGKNWKFSLKADFQEVLRSIQDAETVNNEKYDLNFYATGDFDFGKYIGFSYKTGLNFFNTNDDKNLLMPYGRFDSSKVIIDGFSLYNENLALTFDLNASVSFGTERNYISLGVNKNSYGPFSDSSVTLNEQAYQSLNVLYNYTGKYFDFVQILSALAAKNPFEKNEYSLGKYYVFHSIRFPLFSKKLHLSYYETSIFANAFMPYYILPVPYIIMANVSGFNENVLAGILFEWNPVNCLKFNINLNVDTLEPKSIIKLKFDSGLRTACQIGFEYSPLDSFCNLIKLDYTVATPFTYTFYDNGEVFGFRNHINMGIPMALNIDPNSDRISLSMNFKPKNNFTVKTLTSFIRHGNPFESLSSEEVLSLNSKKYLSDGSQNASDGELETFCDYTNFLTQKSLLFVIQGWIDFEYAFYITKNQNLSFCCSYFFEFIKNDGVNNNIFTGRETTKEQVEESLNIWKENFKERYNHYFSVGVKYTF